MAKPQAKPAGVGGQLGPRLTRAAGSAEHPLKALPPAPSQPAAGRPRRSPRTQRTRTTLYLDEQLLRTLSRVTAQLTVDRDIPYTKTAVLEAALSYGLAHVHDIPAAAFPADARRSTPHNPPP